MTAYRPRNALVFTLLLLTGLAAYLPGLDSGYFADDFQFLDPSPSFDIVTPFTQGNPYNQFYRPFQVIILSSAQAVFGMNTVAIHLMNLVLHALLSFLVFHAAVELGFSWREGLIGAFFMLLSQANVHAVSSLDTVSQIGSTLCGCMSLWSVWRIMSRSGGASYGRWIVYGALWLIAALLFKESGVSFILMSAVLIGWYALFRRDVLSPPATLLTILAMTAVTAGYFLVRWSVVEVHPQIGASNYMFSLGMNIPFNFALLVFSAVTPLSSVDVFSSIKSGTPVFAAAAAVLSAGLAAAVSLEFLASSGRRRRLMAACALLAAAGTFPVVLLNHVSELYTYNMMPFVSVLMGAGLGGLLERSGRVRWRRAAAWSVLTALCVLHLASVREKTLMMKANGELAASLSRQIAPHLARVPRGGRLILLDADSGNGEYSIFVMHGFDVFRSGTNRIWQLAGRSDFSVEILEPGDMEGRGRGGDGEMILMLDEDTVKEVKGLDTGAAYGRRTSG